MQTQFWQEVLSNPNNKKRINGSLQSFTSTYKNAGKWVQKLRDEAGRSGSGVTFCHFRNDSTTTVYKFTGLDLSGLDFGGILLEDVYFERCNLKGSSFRNGVIRDAWFHGCDLTNADFSQSSLAFTVFKMCNLQDVNFAFCHVGKCSFKLSTLKTATLYGCHFADMLSHPESYPALNTHYQTGKLYKLNNRFPFAVKASDVVMGMIIDNKTVLIATASDSVQPIFKLKHECEMFSLIDTTEP